MQGAEDESTGSLLQQMTKSSFQKQRCRSLIFTHRPESKATTKLTKNYHTFQLQRHEKLTNHNYFGNFFTTFIVNMPKNHNFAVYSITILNIKTT